MSNRARTIVPVAKTVLEIAFQRRKAVSYIFSSSCKQSSSRLNSSGPLRSGSSSTSIMADADNSTSSSHHCTSSSRTVGDNSTTETKEAKNVSGKIRSAVPDGYEEIVEGQAKMIYKRSLTRQQEVFYNPVQVQNRDLSILMLCLYAERRHHRNLKKKYKNQKNSNDKATENADKEGNIPVGEQTVVKSSNISSSSLVDMLNKTAQSDGLRILEALAASGLRSIRYSKEVTGIKEIIVNDIDPAAVEQAKENVSFNEVDPNIVKPQQGDATSVLYNNREKGKQFDVIDLDPYGTAAPFLDGAVQAVKNGGLLCITCTDMRVLSGGQADLCYGRYAAMPMPNGKYVHELALRILLQTVSTSANRYGRIIKPILSVGMAFYIRVFIEVYDDSAAAQRGSLLIGNVYQSTQCPSFYTATHGTYNGRVIQPGRGPPVTTCTETGAPLKVGGPIWLGPLHDPEVVNEAILRLENNGLQYPLKAHDMLHGLLTAVSEELVDVPLYYLLPDLCKVIGCVTPPMIKIKAALANSGYKCSGQHKEPMALKTDAPPKVIWDIMRTWTKLNSPQGKVYGEIAGKIMSTEPEINVDFTVPPNFDKRKKVKRFPMNPERDWGPKPKATGKRKSPLNDIVGEERQEQTLETK